MLRDFLDERRGLTLGGRAFEMRRISFGAVVVATSKFSEKIIEAARQGSADAASILDSFTVGDLADLVCLVLDPPDRDFFVRTLDAAILDRWLLELRRMNDLEKITASLNLGPKDASGSPDSNEGEKQEAGPSPMEVVVDAIAQRYGVPPHQVMGWPYEEVLAILDLMKRGLQKAQAAPQEARIDSGHEGIAPFTWGLMGAEYADARANRKKPEGVN